MTKRSLTTAVSSLRQNIVPTWVEDVGLGANMNHLGLSTVILLMGKGPCLHVKKNIFTTRAIMMSQLLNLGTCPQVEDLGMDIHMDCLSISTVTRTVVNLVVEKNISMIHAIMRSQLLSLGICPQAEDLGMEAEMNCLGVRLAITLNAKAPGLRAFIIIRRCRSVDRQM